MPTRKEVADMEGDRLRDSGRLDWLEAFVTKEGALMLHSDGRSNFGSSGLGIGERLRFRRTLREAIDDCMRVSSTVENQK